ncbi:tripartite tricarboxylate transporter substrate binding protein [Cupriavidus malaysiensis]|uniref:ABC transporter substrate-binding protein n=1 Tax=Cupriavidus malaysiensis TaxID=367825 RepID=A0ABM6FA40_9BURK|nr:tripartite tricarboxylate transporter substrate binding protein [Cupriavidus malaysiensis]AOZ08559.1 ABC transporter substrate-binding protein [Cupriavidus malaysiensis]
MQRFTPILRRLAAPTLALALALGALAPAMRTAAAAEWPARPLRILLGAPPGGTADIVARLYAVELQRALGQPVIVDYKPGAAGTIAVQTMLSAPRDGYTFLLIQKGIAAEVPHAIKVSYDPFKDIVPVAQLTRQGLMLVGNPGLPAKSLAELVAYIKANPGKLDYANFGIGLRGQTIGVQFNRLAGLQTGSVNYKGSPPALQDIMGGQVALMFDGPASSLPLIKGGRLRAFAIAFPKRIAALPDVPTFAELGYPELNEVGWMGLWAASGVPPAIVAKVREAAIQAMQSRGLQKKLEELGMEAGTPVATEALARDVRESYERQGALLRSIGFTPQ